MGLSSFRVSFSFSYLLMFLITLGGTYKSEANCSESFECGSLGNMSFPFFKSTESHDCGLCEVDCDAKPPRIELFQKADENDILRVRHVNPATNTIHFRWVNKNDCSNFIDLPLLNTSSISFTFSSNITTLLKCRGIDPSSRDPFPGYREFNECEDPHHFRVYIKKPEDRSDPSADSPHPPLCLAIQLPLAPQAPNLDGNLFDLLADEFEIIWIIHHKGKSKLGLILGTVASTGGIVTLMILVFCFKRKYSSYNLKRDKYPNVENFLNNYGSLAPKRYHYSDVKKMTSSFMIRLGEGGYGSVYKGKLHDGSLVAVKILDETKGNGEEFVNEMASISRTSHVNIVKLLGFCFEHNKRALIYEFMPNGSLDKFIYQKELLVNRQLGWQTIYKIAIGIARGLEYLHCHCNTQILHFDIKPHNILLDKDFSPKISDFGLSKLCTRTKSIVSILGARGTIGYTAPEVVCRTFGRVSFKSDVYSYGMMILETVGGRKNVNIEVDRTSEIYYPHWIYKQLELNEELGLDEILEEGDNEKARKMIMVSLWCIQTNPSSRPSMTKVVEMLEGNLESLQIPPKPFLYSHSRSPVE